MMQQKKIWSMIFLLFFTNNIFSYSSRESVYRFSRVVTDQIFSKNGVIASLFAIVYLQHKWLCGKLEKIVQANTSQRIYDQILTTEKFTEVNNKLNEFHEWAQQFSAAPTVAKPDGGFFYRIEKLKELCDGFEKKLELFLDGCRGIDAELEKIRSSLKQNKKTIVFLVKFSKNISSQLDTHKAGCSDTIHNLMLSMEQLEQIFLNLKLRVEDNENVAQEIPSLKAALTSLIGEFFSVQESLQRLSMEFHGLKNELGRVSRCSTPCEYSSGDEGEETPRTPPEPFSGSFLTQSDSMPRSVQDNSPRSSYLIKLEESE